MLKALATVTLLLLSAPSMAQVDLKREKVAELMRVIRIQDLFEQQIVGSRGRYSQFGQKLLDQILSEAPQLDDEKRGRVEAIFQRYLQNSAAQWTADELIAIWSRHYGEDLSIDDLDQIITFYQSPIGRKSLAANQAANAAYSAEVATQDQSRLQEALKRLAAELREEMGR
jgi:hypothetical protein